MRSAIHLLLSLFLLIHFAFFPKLALAASVSNGFNVHYVDFYQKFKFTHELARGAEKYVAVNPNMAALIKKVMLSIDQPLPEIQLLNGKLYFKGAGKRYELSHRGGTQFIFDGKLFDISKDLSPLMALSDPVGGGWLIPSANAVVPFVVWGLVAIMVVMAGAMVCTNASITGYFSKVNLPIQWHTPPGKFNSYLKGFEAGLTKICPGAANAAGVGLDYDYERFFKNYCGALTPNYRETPAAMASRRVVHSATAERFYGASASEVNKAVIAAAVDDSSFMTTCLADRDRAVATPESSNPLDTAH